MTARYRADICPDEPCPSKHFATDYLRHMTSIDTPKDPLVFNTTFAHVDSRKACNDLRVRRLKNGNLTDSRLVITFIAIVILIAGSVVGIVAGAIFGPQVKGIVVSVAVMAGLYGFVLYLAKKNQSVLATQPLRAGVTKMTLTPEGYMANHPGYDTLTRWSHVTDVLTTDQGLLMLHGDYEYFPIEADAFDSRQQMEDVARQIKLWVDDAKASERL